MNFKQKKFLDITKAVCNRKQIDKLDFMKI